MPTKSQRKPRRQGASGEPRTPGYFERVWQVVRQIPAGRVATYGAVARAAGSPGAARQVVWALRGAPAWAAVPWHRVLGVGGKIRLPGPSGLEQRMRLEAERVTFAGTRVRMDRHEWRFAATTRKKARSRSKIRP